MALNVTSSQSSNNDPKISVVDPDSRPQIIQMNPDVPTPPSDSFFVHVREVYRTSNTVFHYCFIILIFSFVSISYIIMSGLNVIFPLSGIIIGGLYFHDCPQNDNIPVYLIVSGVFSICGQSEYLSKRVCSCIDEWNEKKLQLFASTFISGFLMVWLIIGSVWIFKEYEPNYDPKLGKYCNKTLYLYAFWTTIPSYIIMGISTVGMCCLVAVKKIIT